MHFGGLEHWCAAREPRDLAASPRHRRWLARLAFATQAAAANLPETAATAALGPRSASAAPAAGLRGRVGGTPALIGALQADTAWPSSALRQTSGSRRGQIVTGRQSPLSRRSCLAQRFVLRLAHGAYSSGLGCSPGAVSPPCRVVRPTGLEVTADGPPAPTVRGKKYQAIYRTNPKAWSAPEVLFRRRSSVPFHSCKRSTPVDMRRSVGPES